jgi:nucleotide-binding universal stress UspA family protein
MLAMSGIIVGFDGSVHAQRALEWAVKEAAVREEPLTVLTVWRTAVGYWGAPVIYPGDKEAADNARSAAREALDKAIAEVGSGRPVTATVRAVSGIAAAELVAESVDADLLVIGSRGTGGFARLLLGSVAAQVTHHAHCPIVVVPAEDRHA